MSTESAKGLSFGFCAAWIKTIHEVTRSHTNKTLHFAQLSITPYWRVHHGVTLSIYYQGPDGNRMEFQVDCCANADEAHTFMHSEAFAANPVGVEIDPDELLTQYRSGVPAETLLVQPNGPPSPIPAEHGLS